MPHRCNEGSRGRYAAPVPVKVNTPSRSGPPVPDAEAAAVKGVQASDKPAPAEESPATEEAVLSDVFTKEVAATKSRVDQISMKMSVLDNAMKATERSVFALRDDLSSVSKNAGGHTAERVEALFKQVKTLEQSFCDFSSSSDRKHVEVAEEVSCLRDAARDASTCSPEAGAEDRCAEISMLADEIKDLRQQIAALDSARSEERAHTTQLLLDWLQDTALPDLKRSVLDRNVCSELAQASSQLTYQKLREHMDTEMEQRDGALCQAIHQYSYPLEATVLRESNNHKIHDTVLLRHPISQINENSYMHLVKRGGNGAVRSELFLVMDKNGPCVAFVDTLP